MCLQAPPRSPLLSCCSPPNGSGRPRVSQRGDWLNNGAAFGLTILSNIVLGAVWPPAETGLVNALGGGLVDLRSLPWIAGAIIYLIAMDLGEFLFHRAQHSIPALWAMHSLHHSDRGLNVLTAQRHFWLEPMIKSVTIWLAVALVFKVNTSILAFYAAASLYHLVIHANLRMGFGPFAWLLNSPQYHRIHHSREPSDFNTNFAALLPVFDLLTGSYRRPSAGEFPATGLDEIPQSPSDLLIWPLRGRLGRPSRLFRPSAAP